MTAPLAITCGEPAGIGPEVTVAARLALGGSIPMVWIGDPRHLPDGTKTQVIEDPSQAAQVPGDHLAVLARDIPGTPRPGRPDLASAQGVIDSIAEAVSLTRAGKTSGVCTAPINKKILKDGADFIYPGHTEFLAALGDRDRSVMMLACDMLRVVPVTIHIALRDVPEQLTPDLLKQTARISHAALRDDFGISNPRIAVAGLNPHAGEAGAMGHEELDWIAGCIQELRSEMDIRGPLPADTMFHARARAGYDVALCMYHDQALIPIKTLDFDGGVNVTLGLPFVRTSPDHGTAFDIAGTGQANPKSMINAIKMAWDMAQASE